MLRDYASDLGNRSCNDYVLDDTAENREIAAALHKWADFKPDGDSIYLYDWMVAEWLADQLEKDEDEQKELINIAISTIEGLVEQQAMPDYFWYPTVAFLRKKLKELEK